MPTTPAVSTDALMIRLYSSVACPEDLAVVAAHATHHHQPAHDQRQGGQTHEVDHVVARVEVGDLLAAEHGHGGGDCQQYAGR